MYGACSASSLCDCSWSASPFYAPLQKCAARERALRGCGAWQGLLHALGGHIISHRVDIVRAQVSFTVELLTEAAVGVSCEGDDLMHRTHKPPFSPSSAEILLQR